MKLKLKLDENIGIVGKALLEADGHDVMTVAEQGLSGAMDERIYEVIATEQRVLVTLDRDFGEVLRFPPEATAGIVVLASQGRTTKSAIAARMTDLAAMLKVEPLSGQLWIVEPGRVRIHQKRTDAD